MASLGIWVAAVPYQLLELLLWFYRSCTAPRRCVCARWRTPGASTAARNSCILVSILIVAALLATAVSPAVRFVCRLSFVSSLHAFMPVCVGARKLFVAVEMLQLGLNGEGRLQRSYTNEERGNEKRRMGQ